MKKLILDSIHQYLRGARSSIIPDSHVPRGTYKEYSRMPRIVLPEPEPLAASLDDVLKNRASTTVFKARALEPEILGTLLGHALRIRSDGKRPYPSGGALYPVNTYMVGNIGKGNAVFHYHPREHALEHLWDAPEGFTLRQLIPSIEGDSSSVLIFTATWPRTTEKYKDFGYLLALLEAGHAAQNILLTATALKISARPFEGFNDILIEELLDVSETERPIYSIALG